jgi:hypothetical protein
LDTTDTHGEAASHSGPASGCVTAGAASVSQDALIIAPGSDEVQLTMADNLEDEQRHTMWTVYEGEAGPGTTKPDDCGLPQKCCGVGPSGAQTQFYNAAPTDSVPAEEVVEMPPHISVRSAVASPATALRTELPAAPTPHRTVKMQAGKPAVQPSHGGSANLVSGVRSFLAAPGAGGAVGGVAVPGGPTARRKLLMGQHQPPAALALRPPLSPAPSVARSARHAPPPPQASPACLPA